MCALKYEFQVLPDWQLRVVSPQWEGQVQITPVSPISVVDELHESVPLYTESKWLAGSRLKQLIADECSVSFAFIPDSIRIRRKNDGQLLVNGVDYYVDPVWGAFGRMAESAFGADDAVLVSYSYAPLRLDSVVRKGDDIYQKIGVVNGATPVPPALEEGEELLCNLFFDRHRQILAESMLFPFIEPWHYTPDLAKMEKQLPKTLEKLRQGKPVRILAWGDSVTAAGYIRDPEERWPRRFQKQLQERFPQAQVELINLGWGGKAINTFQCEPPGSPWNYQEKVVESGADLVLLEFVNDAYLTMPAEFQRIYNRVRDDFQAKGMELVVIVPHLIRPDWVGLTSQREIHEDPRPYVKLLKEWISQNNYACADVSARFMHLWKEGIPYNTLMRNNINHPDSRGGAFFVEALMANFPR